MEKLAMRLKLSTVLIVRAVIWRSAAAVCKKWSACSLSKPAAWIAGGCWGLPRCQLSCRLWECYSCQSPPGENFPGRQRAQHLPLVMCSDRQSASVNVHR